MDLVAAIRSRAGSGAGCARPRARLRPQPSDQCGRGVSRSIYADLPGFPQAGVSGHEPKLVVRAARGRAGRGAGGRAHYYEQGDAGAMRVALEVLAGLRGRDALS